MMRIFDLNELAYSELTLSIEVRTSGDKVAFNMDKGLENKDYTYWIASPIFLGIGLV
jgi:hypothetical protein